MEEDKEIERLKEVLAQCEKSRDEYLDGWKRSKADFINYKKDETARLDSFAKFSNLALTEELIGILDSFDLSLAVLKDDSARGGMELIKAQLEDLLKKHGLQKINVASGQKFDPNYHEAVLEIEGPEEEGSVLETVSSGYALHGKVIRPTRVKISKGQKQ